MRDAVRDAVKAGVRALTVNGAAVFRCAGLVESPAKTSEL
jgi:hypothetical protein